MRPGGGRLSVAQGPDSVGGDYLGGYWEGSESVGLSSSGVLGDPTRQDSVSILRKVVYIYGMLGRSTTSCRQPRWKLLVGLLCVALVVLSGTISATHTHGRDNAIHEDCGLCVAAHATVQLTADPPVLALARVFTLIESARPLERPTLKLAFDLFTRPPPVDVSLS